jgi:hypothetical protein
MTSEDEAATARNSCGFCRKQKPNAVTIPKILMIMKKPVPV